MIKFFRHIRKDLMEKNKTGKYLKYAIGEIVLVVIGILIALQINNWNDSRKLASQETLYLNRLISDNQQDIITFSENIDNLKKGNESIERFSEALKNNALDDSLLIHRANEFLKYGSIFPIFYSTTSTFEDLSSTGNLSIIKNSKLRDQIINHYTEHDQMAERIQVSTEWTLPLDGPFYSENTVMNFEPSTAFLYPESSRDVLANQLRDQKLIYINNIAVHYWINADAISRFKALKKRTYVLIKNIQGQLPK